MTRRRALDWALVALLTVCWGAFLVRHVADGLRSQRGKVSIGAASATTAETYPQVNSPFWARDGIEAGDEIVAVDGQSLRGSSTLHFYDLAMRGARERGFT